MKIIYYSPTKKFFINDIDKILYLKYKHITGETTNIPAIYTNRMYIQQSLPLITDSLEDILWVKNILKETNCKDYNKIKFIKPLNNISDYTYTLSR